MGVSNYMSKFTLGESVGKYDVQRNQTTTFTVF